MSKLIDWFFGNKVTRLDLKSESGNNSRILTPKAPTLEINGSLLARFSRKSELVYACVEKKAQAAVDPELVVERKNKDGEYETVAGHPALMLMTKPNPDDDNESFLRAWIASENIAGTFYAEKVRSRAGKLVGLYPLIPTHVFPQYIETSAGSILDHYIYVVNGREVRFKPEELLIRRRHGLNSIYAGMAPLAVALGSVDAEIASTEYVRAFFNNGGAPSGILNIKGRKLSEEEMNAYAQRWMSKYSRNGSQRGGPAVLDGSEVEYTSIGATLDDLNSDSLTSINESRICMAFGVPPILIGSYVGLLHVNQRASVREAQEDFWMNTMSPELKSIRKFLDRSVLTEFEDPSSVLKGEIRFNWNMSKVDALQEDLNEIHKRASDGYKAGLLTLNEARADIGLRAVEDDRGDEFYKAPPQIGISSGDTDQKTAFPAIEVKKPEPLQLPEPALNPDDAEKKTEKSDEYARQPTELELLINFKSLESDQAKESTRLSRVLMGLRNTLIASSVDLYGEMEGDSIASLSLTPPVEIYSRIRKLLVTAFRQGQFQVIEELRRQGADFDDVITDAVVDTFATLDVLVDMAVSTVVNEVQSRVIDRVVSLTLTGASKEEIGSQLQDDLLGESTTWVDEYAGATVNSTIQTGRDLEMEELSDQIGAYIYSGILDKNICTNCRRWDGEMSETREDLPHTPNPKCKGRHRCRCFVIAVHDTDDFVAEENEVR